LCDKHHKRLHVELKKMKFDIGDYVSENFNKVKKTSTGQLTTTCPFCDKFGAFYIDEDSGNFICFKCDNKGRGFAGVIAQVEGISFGQAKAMMVRQAVHFQRRETTVTLLEKIQSLKNQEDVEIDFEDDSQVDFDLPDEFVPVESDGKWRFPVYLKERGIKKKTAKAWGLGFCNSGDYGGRVVFPVVCPNGRSFVARSCEVGIEPKIRNPPGADHSRLLFGWNMIDEGCDFVLCEGPFDAVKLWQHGLKPLAMFGKVLHREQRRLLYSRPSDSSVTIMTDPEEISAPYEIAIQLMMHFEKVFIAKLPIGIDPGDSTKKQAMEAYDNAKEYNGGRHDALSDRIASTKRNLEKTYR
jgi:DNA primase